MPGSDAGAVSTRRLNCLRLQLTTDNIGAWRRTGRWRPGDLVQARFRVPVIGDNAANMAIAGSPAGQAGVIQRPVRWR
jgi:hypothetical protein